MAVLYLLAGKTKPIIPMQSNVFILYTGGTFGMKKSEKYGLQPSSWGRDYRIFTCCKKTEFFFLFQRNSTSRLRRCTPIIDSSDITPETWHHIAEKIQKNYASHDGFIIIHGTDTLAYTSSALSYIFENLSKPIISYRSSIAYFSPTYRWNH